jgi:GTP-binding protein HflX
MMKDTSVREKALLVVIDWGRDGGWLAEDSLAELEELVKTSRTQVVETLICHINKPNPAYLIGKGKLEQIAQVCQMGEVNVVIFSEDLSGTQQRNLEEVLSIKTIDRTQLILDIFAQHAKSPEGNLQVELAQLEYLLPRLTGKGIMLSRLGGGIGTRGPGEKKLEIDRRRIRERITKLKQDLRAASTHRAVMRKKRIKNVLASLALVGYTNAGKSTLLNSLTDSSQIVRNSLFTTLDPLSRNLTIGHNQRIVISDTVGFLYHLPHHLIEAFKATLEEVREADILLNVLDISHPKFREHNKAVYEVLEELQSHQKPIITVLNKIDLLSEQGWTERLKRDFPNAVAISALNKDNISELLDKIQEELKGLITVLDLFIPIERMDLVDRVYKEGQVFSINYTPRGAEIKASLPIVTAKKMSAFTKNS